jgi:MFS family permease
MSNLTLGVVVDRYGARKVLAFGFTTMALLFFVWPLCVTTTQIYVLSFSCGYFQGPISSLPIIILADAFANSSPEHILALNGITNGCKFPGYLFGSAIASSIAEKYGAYSIATALSGIVLVIGSIIMLLLIPSPDEQQRQLAEKKSHGYSSGEHIAIS